MSNVRITVENLLSRVDAYIAWSIEYQREREEEAEKGYLEDLKYYENSSWFARTFILNEPIRRDWLTEYCLSRTKSYYAENIKLFKNLALASDDGMVTITDNHSFILGEKFDTRKNDAMPKV